jgi:hypothetical protein
MRRFIVLFLVLGMFALPAAAQTAAAPAPPARTLVVPAAAPQGFSAGHAMALGVGLFAGAMLGSALINGGALAATIGAVAGVAVGHWLWTEQRDAAD